MGTSLQRSHNTPLRFKFSGASAIRNVSWQWNVNITQNIVKVNFGGIMMIICISASNIMHAGKNSTSIKICELINEMVQRKNNKNTIVEIISLAENELKPCIGCGKCFNEDKCVSDKTFNRIYQKLTKAEALFIISAHYAPIPAKLSMLLEKMEQLAFLRRFNDESYRSPLYGKPVGIIGHGGGGEEIIRYYKGPVIDSICNALSYPIEMNIVSGDNEQIKGVLLPVKIVKKVEHSIFPLQEYDWNDIEDRLNPLVENILKEIEMTKIKK